MLEKLIVNTDIHFLNTILIALKKELELFAKLAIPLGTKDVCKDHNENTGLKKLVKLPRDITPKTNNLAGIIIDTLLILILL